MKYQDENISALLIEDNLADARLLYELVRETRGININLEHVTKLSAGLDQLKKANYDIIIADLRLPDSFGLEILSKIRENDDHTAVVVLSGFEDEELGIQAIQNGAQDYILKNLMDSGQIVRSFRYAIERKKIENKLIQNEENFRMMFDQAAVGIGYMDLNGSWTKINSKLAEILGSSEKKPNKITFENFFKDQIDLSALLEKKSDNINKEISVETKNKKTIWLDVTISLIKDINENPKYFIAVLVDTTQKKHQEEVLRFSEEKFRLITENSHDMISMTNENENFVYVSPSITKKLGYTPENLKEKKFSDIVHPEDQTKLDALKSSEIVQFRVKDENGNYIWIEGTSYKITTHSENLVIAVTRDISERKKVEDQIKLSEEKYRTLFETMLEGVVYQDENGKIISANPAAEKMLGLSSDELQGKISADPEWLAVREDGSDFPGDEHPSMQALKTGKEVKNVIMGIYNSEENNYRWLSISAVPQFRSGEEKPYQVYTTFSDITKIKEFQEALKKEELQTRRVLDIAGVMILVLNEKGEIVKINKRGSELLKVEEKDAIGKNWINNFIPQEEKEKVSKVLSDLLQNKKPQSYFINSVISENGEIRTILFTNTLFTDDAEKFIISSGQDITEQTQYQKSFLQSEQKFKTTLEKASAGIAYLNSQGKILSVNTKLAEIFGTTEKDFLDQNLKDVISKNLPDEFVQKFNDFFYGAAQSISEELCLQNCGTENAVWANLSISRISEEPNSNIIFILENISELKKVRSELTGYIEQINSKQLTFDENTRQMAEINERLKKMSASKEKIFSMIARELKDPFSTVQGFSEYLYQNINELNKDEIRDFSERIFKNVRNTIGIVDNLLQYSRLSAGNVEYLPVKFNLNALAGEVLESYKPKAFKYKVELLNEVPEKSEVFADRIMTASIFRNLISNAIKFNKKDGKVFIRAKENENNFEIIVEDSGIGISPEKLKNLFDLNENLQSENGSVKNIPMGIILCSELVKINGGEIKVESEPEKGSKFIFTLPKN